MTRSAWSNRAGACLDDRGANRGFAATPQQRAVMAYQHGQSSRLRSGHGRAGGLPRRRPAGSVRHTDRHGAQRSRGRLAAGAARNEPMVRRAPLTLDCAAMSNASLS